MAARHLCSFGYNVALLCPKPGKSPLFSRLIQQARVFGVVQAENVTGLYDLIVDAIFGIIREPSYLTCSVYRLQLQGTIKITL